VEDGGVDVSGHLHQKEPVAVLAFLQDGADVIAVIRLGTVAQKHEPAITAGN